MLLLFGCFGVFCFADENDKLNGKLSALTKAETKAREVFVSLSENTFCSKRARSI